MRPPRWREAHAARPSRAKPCENPAALAWRRARTVASAGGDDGPGVWPARSPARRTPDRAARPPGSRRLRLSPAAPLAAGHARRAARAAVAGRGAGRPRREPERAALARAPRARRGRGRRPARAAAGAARRRVDRPRGRTRRARARRGRARRPLAPTTPPREAHEIAARGLLPGDDGRWLDEPRRELEQLHLDALELLAGAGRPARPARGRALGPRARRARRRCASPGTSG